jgi:hopanoid biosynthesis associated protein HpnK
VQKYLIVTADDFGLHEAVNDAVEQAAAGGILTAASLMVSGPAAADAVRRAQRLPGLRVGLHLVLADGPASLPHHQIPSIADADGHMSGEMFWRGIRYFSSPSVRRQLEAEISAQFAAFERTGLRLDHVNVHKHYHVHPTILSIIMRVARDLGAPAVRVPDEPSWFAAHSGPWHSKLSRGLLAPWLMLMKHRLRAAGILHNDRIFGIAASGAMDEARLLAILARLPRGITEIYLHPATLSGAIAASMSDYQHAAELEALLSPRVRAAVEAPDIRRGGYSDMPRHRGSLA